MDKSDLRGLPVASSADEAAWFRRASSRAIGANQSLGLSPSRLLSASQINTQQARVSVQHEAALLNLRHEAIVVRDAVTDAVAFWSLGAEVIYGWRRAEIVGQPAHTLLQTRFPQPRETIEAALRRDGHWEGQLDHRRRDGRSITVASCWALQRDIKGGSVAILEISIDITARTALERALGGRKASTETAQRIAHPGSFYWDFVTDTVHWSDEMFRLLGHARGQVTPSFATFLKAVHPDDRPMIVEFMTVAFAGKTAPFAFRTVGRREVVRTLHVQTEVVRDATGSGTLIFGTALDIEANTVVRRPPQKAAIRDPGLATPFLYQRAKEPEGMTPPLAVPLTPREREVLQLLSQGLTNRQIGRACTLSVATVNTHVEHILAKLKVTDRTQAAVRGIELGVVTLAQS